MLSFDLSQFMFELKEGAIKHIGPSTKTATVKLYDVEETEVRAFGDKRVKTVFTDDDGNEVEVALFPEEALALKDGLAEVEAESGVFE